MLKEYEYTEENYKVILKDLEIIGFPINRFKEKHNILSVEFFHDILSYIWFAHRVQALTESENDFFNRMYTNFHFGYGYIEWDTKNE